MARDHHCRRLVTSSDVRKHASEEQYSEPGEKRDRADDLERGRRVFIGAEKHDARAERRLEEHRVQSCDDDEKHLGPPRSAQHVHVRRHDEEQRPRHEVHRETRDGPRHEGFRRSNRQLQFK